MESYNNQVYCPYCGSYNCTCNSGPPMPPIPPCPPDPDPPTPDPDPPAAVACQMMGYSSGLVPMLLANAGFDLEALESEIAKIPGVGDDIVAVIEKVREEVNKVLAMFGIDPITGKLECDIAGNLGMGSWIPNVECNGKQGIELIQPQAYSFTACQSGSICGLNASFGNIVSLNLSGKVAFVTAHVEVRKPSCAPGKKHEWVDVSPVDPKTCKRGVALINQGDNAYCDCGDGIFPLGAVGNSYTTPGCATVGFCPETARINCGDMVRIVFKATEKKGAAADALFFVGFGNASVCIKPDPMEESECGCGCPCKTGYPKPSCKTIECGCDEVDCDEPEEPEVPETPDKPIVPDKPVTPEPPVVSEPPVAPENPVVPIPPIGTI